MPDEINDGRPFWPHENPYDFKNRIMLTAIISLSVVITVVTAIRMYARYVLRREAHRRATRRLAPAHVNPNEPHKTGLDPTVIASLPIFLFKQTEGHDDHDTTTTFTTECAVCLSNLEDQEMVMLLPNCKHTFHAECINKWLSSNSTCPICRTEAEPRVVVLQAEPREGPTPADGRTVTPTAPPLEHMNSALITYVEGTSSDGGIWQSSTKVNGSSSRMNSFRRMVGREKSSRRINASCGENQDGIQDLERQ